MLVKSHSSRTWLINFILAIAFKCRMLQSQAISGYKHYFYEHEKGPNFLRKYWLMFPLHPGAKKYLQPIIRTVV